MLINIITKKLWSAGFLFLVMIILVFVATSTLSSLLEKNRKSQETLSGYIGGNTEVTILKQDTIEAQAMKETLTTWLLSPRDTVDLVTYVETISRRVNLEPTIEDLNAQKKVTLGEGESAALELIVKLEGTLEDVFKFLNIMENIPYQSHIEDARLQRIGQQESDVWQILVQMIVYTSPQE